MPTPNIIIRSHRWESEGPCLDILSPHDVSDMELIGKHQTQWDFTSGLLADHLKWLIADLLAARIFIGIFMTLAVRIKIQFSVH